jgi:predicted P-loop ATPase
LKFISDIYEKLYNPNDKVDILVVSVVGVQSSGKSLLLNFLFGT